MYDGKAQIVRAARRERTPPLPHLDAELSSHLAVFRVRASALQGGGGVGQTTGFQGGTATLIMTNCDIFRNKAVRLARPT